MNFFNAFSFSGFLIAITFFPLFLYIITRGKTRASRLYSLHILSLFIWGLGSFLIGSTQDYHIALNLWKWTYVGVLFISVSFYHTVSIIIEQRKRLALILVYVQAVFFCIHTFQDKIFSSLQFLRWGFYYPSRNIEIIISLSVWTLVIFFSHWKLYKFYARGDQRVKQPILFLMVSGIFGLTGAFINFLPVFGFSVYPFGNYFELIYAILATAAILKLSLTDIPIVITRTGIFVAVYSAILGIPFILAFGYRPQLEVLVGENWWGVPLFISMVLATSGPFMYLFFQRRAEERLLKEQKQYQMTLRKASIGMGKIKDLGRLLRLIVYTVVQTVNVDFCAVYLFNKKTNQYVLTSSKGRVRHLVSAKVLKSDSAVVKYLKQERNALSLNEARRSRVSVSADNQGGIIQYFESFKIELIVPSFVDESLVAIIVLGKKKSGDAYSEDDKAVFSILANQSALAIENAQFYEDVRQTHEQIFKAEKMATLGTMADGLSHQINNRLHAMGFIAGDLLDTIRLKEKDGFSQATKEIVADVNKALLRVQDNVKTGAEIVEGLLKYTRKGEEGFEKVDLNKLLDASLEMAQFKIKLGEMKFIREFNSDLHPIYGNFTMLQEVFFNIIDNAYDAMMERKIDLAESGYQPQMSVAAEKKGKNIEIVVKDNGIGVKQEDQAKLFTPFFSTKVVHKKGTGLGMYVIRQIIEDNHEGKIKFSSEYKVGSQSWILLPAYSDKN